MSFIDAVMSYYGLNPTDVTAGNIFGDASGITISLNLRIPNEDMPEIAALMQSE